MNKEYWERNINHWSKLYLDISHADEKFSCPRILEVLYHRFITPIESRVMQSRYDLTIAFIEANVKPGDVVGDLGCGSGIFTVELLKRGASVVCVDYTKAALEMTRKLVARQCPKICDRVRYIQMDLTQGKIPRCDVAIAMGVTPYVDDIEAFFGNILPQTKTFFCLMVDPANFLNRIRTILPVLNVRKLRFHGRNKVDAIYAKHYWVRRERTISATAYLDRVEKAG